MKRTTTIGALMLTTAALANQTTFVETYEDGGNEGNWSYFGDPDNPVEVIETSGGNPDAYLHSTCAGLSCLDTFAPQFRTQLGVSSQFTGDYREQGVLSVGIDLILLDVDFGAEDRPLTVMLFNEQPGIDVAAYFVGTENVPEVGEGWKVFDFDIPADSPTLPARWRISNGTGAGDDADWNTVITDVDQLVYFYGDPDYFFIFQQWEPGADNPRIVKANSCKGDLDGCGIVGFSDLLIVLGNWGPYEACPPYHIADIDEDCFVGFSDLLLVLGAWGPCP